MPKTDKDIIKQLENKITMFLEGDFPMEERIDQKPIFEERLKDLVWGFGEFEELKWRTISINLFKKKLNQKTLFDISSLPASSRL